MYSPIVIFSYNRPKHLNNLFESLALNKISKLNKIFFFCDGPKNKYDKKKISEIKLLLKKKKLIFTIKFLEKKI